MSTREATDPPAARRVAVMLENGAMQAALRAAAELAQMLNVDLSGWFVEDARLLNLAQFPFAREADWTSAALRPLQTASLERALRLAAQSAERQWREAIRTFDVSASFRTVRESPQRQLLRLTREFGVVVLSPQRAWPAAEGRARAPATARPLVAVIEAQHAAPHQGRYEAQHGLELAARWAAQRRRPLHLVWCSGEAAAQPDQATVIAEGLRKFDIEVATQVIARSQQALENALRRAQPEGVILNAVNELVQPDRLRSLAALLRCPVVLVR